MRGRLRLGGAPSVALSFEACGEGPAVLLIHGGGFDKASWRKVAADLSADHRVVAYNRRGYRDSGPAATAIEAHADDAARLLHALHAVPATAVGHSFGAIVALELARRHRHLVTAVVLLEPTLHARGTVTPHALWTYLKVRFLRRLKGERAAAALFGRWMTTYRGGGSAWAVYSPTERRSFLANAPGLFADLAAGDGAHIRPEALVGLGRPVTVAVGELTRPWFRRSGERIAALLDAPTPTLPGAGHDLVFDRPQEVAALVRRATDRHDQASDPVWGS